MLDDKEDLLTMYQFQAIWLSCGDGENYSYVLAECKHTEVARERRRCVEKTGGITECACPYNVHVH